MFLFLFCFRAITKQVSRHEFFPSIHPIKRSFFKWRQLEMSFLQRDENILWSISFESYKMIFKKSFFHGTRLVTASKLQCFQFHLMTDFSKESRFWNFQSSRIWRWTYIYLLKPGMFMKRKSLCFHGSFRLL